MKNLWNAVKAFISDYFGDESAAINETMKLPAKYDKSRLGDFDEWIASKALPVDYPAVDQSDEMLEDGFGSRWINRCGNCGQPMLEIVRPGKVQCHSDVCNSAESAPVVKPKYEVLHVIISDQFSDQWQTSPYRVSGDRVYIHADYAGCKARIEYTVNGAYKSKTVRLKKSNGSARR